RRALDTLDREPCVVRELVRSERDGGLAAGLVLLEQRAAPRAVVRRLRVLVPALGAVDMAHGRGYSDSGGGTFPVRMSVSWSTSMCVPFCFIRAVRSARRMSSRP